MGDRAGFMKRCKEAFEAASAMENPLIVHHYDCDGITSGSIVAAWFEKNGKPYRMRTIRKVDAEIIEEVKNEKQMIFVDLGSGSPIMEELKGEVVIIDHHQPLCRSHLQANPHHFGFDGGTDLSAAGCAYFVFRTAPDLGVTGAVGDIQYPLRSLNKEMLDEAVEKHQVAVSTDLLLFGRNSRPLTQLLAFADEPFLPGLTGHDDACIKFLAGLGIELREGEKWRTYNDLRPSEKKKLVSALAEHLSMRISPEAAQRLTGEVFTLLNRQEGTELRDASEFSTLLNACGRNSQPELGVDVCLGRKGAYEKARVLLAEHRRNLRDGISFAMKNVQDLGKFLLIDGRGVIADSIIGVVAGMLFPGARNKPVLALSLEESGKIKLSTRGTRKLVENGLNLGKILSESCAAVGGVGGGHNIAAGATIPADKLDEFLKEFAKRV
ncbi:DHHA1 domain protein [uncultured archaeon]|nr:DHHA1 domain protein [uncultured archaeon]